MFTMIIEILLLLVIVKLMIKTQIRRDTSTKCLVGKTALVTGASTGIGLSTALEFAKRGAKVILACRNREKGEFAKEYIIRATGNQNVAVRIVDLQSLGSVRNFANEINTIETKLHILVNNAAAIKLGNKTTDDGFNLIMQINYFAPYLLTILLLGLMKRSAPSRIINVTCTGLRSPKIDPYNLNEYPSGKCPELLNYANSKMALILFSNELARRLGGTDVTVNSVHPGPVDTEILRNANCCLWSPLLLLKCICFKTPDEGAQTILHVALSDDVRNTSGKYFSNCKTEWSCFTPKDTFNVYLAKEVWKCTERLLKLSDDEKLKE